MMKCGSCGAELVSVAGPLRLSDGFVGPYVADVREHLECAVCGEILIPGEAAAVVDAARLRRLEELLLTRPLGDFVTASQAAEMLGVSRQALHKNRRVRNGFIFHVRFGESVLYLQQSVELFKDLGDGRFPLFAVADTTPEEVDQYTDSEALSSTDSEPYARFYANIARWLSEDSQEALFEQGSSYVEARSAA